MKQWNKYMAAGLAGASLALTVPTFATALTADRATPTRTGQLVGLTQGSNTIYAGSIVAVNSAGAAVAASDTASIKVVGRAEGYSDNLTAATYSATKTITVRRGVFRWKNGGSFTAADIGSLAYVQDDQTVTTAAAAANDIVAGIIVDYDSVADEVWVDTYAVGGQGAASVTTLAASGNASVGGTFAVAGASTLTGNTIVTGTLNTTGTMTAVNNLRVGGTHSVTGVTTLVGNTFIAGTLTSTGAVTAVSTMDASGYKLAGVSMWTGIITNLCPAGTNITRYVGGVISNNVVTP